MLIQHLSNTYVGGFKNFYLCEREMRLGKTNYFCLKMLSDYFLSCFQMTIVDGHLKLSKYDDKLAYLNTLKGLRFTGQKGRTWTGLNSDDK